VKLLVDTGALLALAIRNDQNHAKARRFLAEHARARFVLTELIIAEVATRVRARAGAAKAAEVAGSLLGSRRYELVLIDLDLLRGSLEQMKRFADKQLSLTDCASFELMERLGLDAAFSFDTDFRDCGFRMVPS
jgi:predicted nucleic acid-binding protein